MFWNPETVSFGGRNPAEVDQAFGWEVSHTGHLWRLDEDPEAKNTTRPPIGEMGEYELGFPVSGITGCPEEHYFFFGSKHHKLNSSNGQKMIIMSKNEAIVTSAAASRADS